MEDIKLAFLGTGSAIPTKKHNHVAILASFADENLLFDCGEGTQRQFRYAEISATKITKIFITHWHGDHILGLPGLFQTLAMSNYSRTLHIYGPRGTRRFIQLIQELIFDFHINLEVHEISSGTVLETRDYKVEAAEMSHGTPTLAYSLILKDKIRLNKAKIKKLKLPNSPILKELQQGKDITVNGKKIKAKSVVYVEKGKKVTFVLDTSYNERAVELAKDSDILVTECSFSKEDADKAREYRHLTSEDAAKIAKLSKSKKLLLTHLSFRYEHNPHLIEKEAKRIFKNTKVVNDLDALVI
ncbi:MAG: ribonuclease Z [archaeon]|jgi:ribonuclease Z|nr:ribonuclease Z [archaeon]